jgi:hypothetical protein
VIKLEDFFRAYAELKPDDRKNPFDKAYESRVLAEDIASGPQVDASALTEID